MRFSDEHAKNLLARLFAYSPRPLAEEQSGKRGRHRNALEDYCTEALAWCLINSESFRSRVFKAECFAAASFRPESLEVDTQLSFSGKGADSDDNQNAKKLSDGRFDLVLRSVVPAPFLVVIECKVAPDAPASLEKQIKDYRQYISGSAFNAYSHKLVLLLTPYADKHKADGHLSWDYVHDALIGTLLDPRAESENAVLKQFADFLKIRNLAKMKLPSVAPLLGHLKQTAPLLAGLQAIFESIGNDELGRAIFRKDARLPKMEFDEKRNALWYGIWSRGSWPFYYIGFHTSCSGNEPLSLSLQVSFEGDRRAEVVPEVLTRWFNKRDSGEEDHKTNFVFTTEIKPGEDNPGAIEGWILARLRDTNDWVKRLSKGTKIEK
jgi:hypothetical protein